jgi:hypothetical protein
MGFIGNMDLHPCHMTHRAGGEVIFDGQCDDSSVMTGAVLAADGGSNVVDVSGASVG